jgi:hypothetical protein
VSVARPLTQARSSRLAEAGPAHLYLGTGEASLAPQSTGEGAGIIL